MSRHVFLTGFMATGKSTVGRLLAARLRRPFLDLDDAIEAAAGRSVAEIFEQEGEAGFRRRETAALQRITAGPAAVVATGGGAACHGDNLAHMRACGLVVALTAPLDVVKARAGAAADERARPLLQRPPGEIEALFRRRVPIYRQAHACVRTEDSDPALLARHVAGLVARAEALPADVLAQASLVALSREEDVYPVIVSEGALGGLGALLERVLQGRRVTRVAVVSDSNVGPLYGQRVVRALAAVGLESTVHVVPAGERAKSFGELARLIDGLVEAGLDRRSLVIALGGGVVGDLAGFAAASLYRGVACVQVPTTLLAMVDASIGGKTGIDIPAGKNLVGAFWQPRLVAADPDTLATLPARERRAAFGEVIKYALLDGEELYGAVDALAPAMAAEGPAPGQAPEPTSNLASNGLTGVIRRCAAIKSWIVTRDEREETGERALLNLGHTLGHAIEAAHGYDGILHGEAVALGLVAACRVSARLGLCEPTLEARVADSVRRAGLDADIDQYLRGHLGGGARVLDFIGTDKKRTGQRIGFVTVRAVGDCGVTELPLDELTRILLP
jgi:shikimate kinase/3-dehydroquinate synthase